MSLRLVVPTLFLLALPAGSAALGQSPSDSLARRKRAECIAAFNSAGAANRQNQVQKKVLTIMNDQDALQKFSLEYKRLDDELKAAKAKNDTSAVRQLNAEVVTLLSVDAKADSIANVRKCGPVI